MVKRKPGTRQADEATITANDQKELPGLRKDSLIVQDASLLPMKILSDPADYLDTKTVSWKYYNNFNFSKLSSKFGNMPMTLGVTSANSGEGKTHVAANMAVSLARAYQRRTVLVDMNFKNPQMHRIFGSQLEPGIAEALEMRTMRVVPTAVEDLFLMTAGDCNRFRPGIEHTIALREILYTLKNEFDFVILDTSSVFPIRDFPVHFINEIDGLISVVDTQSTKKAEFDRIYKHIDEHRFIGYIFNRVDEKE